MKDLGLSYKIMKLINSSIYYFRNKVSSIRYAITFLGEIEITKWLYVVLLNDLKGILKYERTDKKNKISKRFN